MALCGNIQEVVSEAAARAKDADIPVSFDMNYRTRLWTPKMARDITGPLIKGIEILFCGRSDAQRVFGCTGSPKEIVTQLAELSGAHTVVMSMSHEGLMSWQGGKYWHVPARDVVILDRIGAGDAMVAGVLHGYLQGEFRKGLEYGALLAALSLSQYGDQPVTNRSELEVLLEEDGGDIVR